MSIVTIPDLPRNLTWQKEPEEWHLDDAELTISAGARTDLFIDPAGTSAVTNSPLLLMPVSEDCLLQAQVTVDFAATFDAGVLIIYAAPERWAKFCFEFSPVHVPTIVSVVTRGASDDCNSTEIAGNRVYLRIARLGSAWAFHYSHDAVRWNLVRYFTLGEVAEPYLGFSAQSPTGDGCRAHFSAIRFTAQRLADLRSGD